MVSRRQRNAMMMIMKKNPDAGNDKLKVVHQKSSLDSANAAKKMGQTTKTRLEESKDRLRMMIRRKSSHANASDAQKPDVLIMTKKPDTSPNVLTVTLEKTL